MYLPVDEWVKKLYSVHAVEHYLVLKGDLASCATWMGLGDIMLSEARQIEGKLNDVTCHVGY